MPSPSPSPTLTALPTYDKSSIPFKLPPSHTHRQRGTASIVRAICLPTWPSVDHRSTTSWLFPPLVLAAIRFVSAAYIFTTLIVIFVTAASRGAVVGLQGVFLHFSGLSYLGLGVYLAISGADTVCYALTGRGWVARWPVWLAGVYRAMRSCALVLPWLISGECYR